MSIPLTKQRDWSKYYSDWQIDKKTFTANFMEKYLIGNPGKIFELGCGGSRTLAKAANLGWEVGGIDLNKTGIKVLKDYLCKINCKDENILYGDIFEYDCSMFYGKYDLLVSFGFLEHFKNPADIIQKWKKILKPQGIIISSIPNLFSINAKIREKFDSSFWKQHIRYSPTDMDNFHFKSGLSSIKKAKFIGKYSVGMLLPWSKAGDKILWKVIKNLIYYGPQQFFSFFPKNRMLSTHIIGIYKTMKETNQ